MTNKERYIRILAKCQAAINTIRDSEHTIVSERNQDTQENMYKLSTNTLRYLLDTSFDDDLTLEGVWDQLEMEDYFDKLD